MIAKLAAPSEPTPPDAAVPDWFARGRIVREARTAGEAAAAVEQAPPPMERSPLRRIFGWIVGGTVLGYALSLALHLILLLLFSWIALNLSLGGAALSTQLGVPDEQGDEILDTRAFELSSGSEGADEPVVTAQPLPLDMPTPEPSVATAMEELKGVADGAGDDDRATAGAGDDIAFELPSGANAVSEGSFTAWTVPEDPRPGQDYIIAIEVVLPSGTERYTRNDLMGQLIGTDGYRIGIPDGREYNGVGWGRPRRTPIFRREGDKARIVFFVRGAHQALVRDTIQIRSRLLNEQQRLRITF